MKTHIEKAALEYAYLHLERNAPHILEAIDKDLGAGQTPEQIERTWRMHTFQSQMAKMVGNAARYISDK